MENVVCRGVPVFALFRESGRRLAAPGASYVVKAFSHGLRLRGPRRARTKRRPCSMRRRSNALAGAGRRPISLPCRTASTWVERAHARRARATARPTTPTRSGRRSPRTARSTCRPATTSSPTRCGCGRTPCSSACTRARRSSSCRTARRHSRASGRPKPLLEAPKGGSHDRDRHRALHERHQPARGRGEVDGRRAVDDERRALPGRPRHERARRQAREPLQQHAHRRIPISARRWDSQYPSLWVTDGGGGTFFDIWTPSTFAQAGMLVISNTVDERARLPDLERAPRALRGAAAQRRRTGSSTRCRPRRSAARADSRSRSRSTDSRNITLANLHIYRVISSDQPFPYAIESRARSDIRFRNVHCYSNSKVAYDATRVRPRARPRASPARVRLARRVGPRARRPRRRLPSRVLEPGAVVERLAGGFHNISGGAADRRPATSISSTRAGSGSTAGRLASAGSSTVADAPLQPVNLAFDKAGNLLVVSYAGNGTRLRARARSGRPDEPDAPRAAAGQPRGPARRVILPVGDWRLQRDAKRRAAATHPPVSRPPTAAASSRRRRASSTASRAGA